MPGVAELTGFPQAVGCENAAAENLGKDDDNAAIVRWCRRAMQIGFSEESNLLFLTNLDGQNRTDQAQFHRAPRRTLPAKNFLAGRVEAIQVDAPEPVGLNNRKHPLPPRPMRVHEVLPYPEQNLDR